MCPLCITAGTLYLASAGAGSAGGLAAVAAKVMRGRRGHQGQKTRPDRLPNPASSHAKDGVSFRVANIKCQETIDAADRP